MRGGPWNVIEEDLTVLLYAVMERELRLGWQGGQERVKEAVTLVLSRHTSVLPACRIMALK